MRYSSILASVACVLSIAPVALAQSAPAHNPPKTSWGVPDVQGIFTSASLTTMTRPAGASGLIISDEEAAKLFNRNIYTRVAKEEAGLSKLDEASSKELLADNNPDRGYNRFWMDPGEDLGKINGQYRSSWIVEPANGQIPFIKNTGAARAAASEEEFADLGSDGPEQRGLPERCIWGFTGGPGPVLRNALYNNTYQIVQTPTHVMIVAEMNHDVRIIPIDVARNPANPPKWGGDSVGHYEGNALVVETVNVMPKQNSNITDKGKVTERFSRMSDGRILYEYTVEDPALYTQSWKGEMPLNIETKGMFEYACHEGNYGMFNLLSGGRQYERDGRKNGVRKQIFAGVAEEP
ncbi:MAG: hypothetical protein IPO30_07675 [Hyphomonadaceae bacterium]|nr:hypothetical protein [Hyphomonadaceae bacterium]